MKLLQGTLYLLKIFFFKRGGGDENFDPNKIFSVKNKSGFSGKFVANIYYY